MCFVQSTEYEVSKLKNKFFDNFIAFQYNLESAFTNLFNFYSVLIYRHLENVYHHGEPPW